MAVLTVGLALVTGTVGVHVARADYPGNTTYYIDNSGSCSDTMNNGTDPSTPWCDFANVNGQTFAAGDQILLKSGDTFADTSEEGALSPLGSGSSGDPITIGCYDQDSGADCATSYPVIEDASEGDVTSLDCIDLTDPSYVTVTELTLENCNNGIQVTYDQVNNNDVTMQDLNINSFHGQAGIEFDGYNDGTAVSGEPGYYSPQLSSGTIINGITIANVAISTSYGATGYVGSGIYLMTDAALGPSFRGQLGGDTSAQENILIENSSFSNLVGEAIQTENASDMRVIDSSAYDLDQNGEGGTGNYNVGMNDVTWVNDVWNLVPWENYDDNSLFNLDNTVTNLTWEGNYFRAASGSALEWTENPCLDDCSSTTDTGAEISNNAFSLNSTEDGLHGFYGDIDTTFAPYATGSVDDNLYYDVSQTNNAFCHSCANYAKNGNEAADSDVDVANAAYNYGTYQSYANWYYTSNSCGSWANMSYSEPGPSSDSGTWTDGCGGSISQFDETPPTNGNVVTRVWTAPKSGTIDIRGWIVMATSAGGSVYAEIKDNDDGLSKWSSTLAGDDTTGLPTDASDISVSEGTQILFWVTNNGSDTSDTVSWSPSIAYTSSSESGNDQVVNVNSGKCMQITSDSTSDLAYADQWECDEGASSEWSLVDEGSSEYELVNANSGMCLQVLDDSTTAGAQVIQEDCSEGSSKLWTLSPDGEDYQLINDNSSDLCLQVSYGDEDIGQDNGTDLSLWDCGTTSTRWDLNPG